MKKIISLLVVSILLCSFVSALASNGDKYDLSDYGYRTVSSKGRGSLIFQKSPGGSFMTNYKYYDGDQIYVNLNWRKDGYAIAYEDGEYGYVDASYIDWGEGLKKGSGNNKIGTYPDQRYSNWQLSYIGEYYVANCEEWVSLREHADTSSTRLAKVPLGAKVINVYDTIFDFYLCDYNGEMGFILKEYLSEYPPRSTQNNDKYDLDQYEYREVVSKGRGSLIFQSSPGGKFLTDHKFYDGDWIYVNVNWRQNGYAMAYEDGEYGYVDDSYIDW